MGSITLTSCGDESEQLEENAKLEQQFSTNRVYADSGKDEEDEDKD
ncbi:hypothetical protein [Tenacibaculum maritimum]|nr:hypothetical protein [Tenacibaculum maritimum]